MDTPPPPAVALIVTAPVPPAGLMVTFVPATMEVTPLAPAGVAHVPSPLQKVVPEAEVPLPRFVTGRLPDTPVSSAMVGSK